jgi:formylglycine-generating enzyme required for sulfatase activity
MKLVLIPSGEFLMGAPDEDPNPVSEGSTPQHLVRITKPFYMGACEVTQADFTQLMKGRANYPVPPFFSAAGGGKSLVENVDTDRLPIDNVGWNLADEFCRRLSELPEERSAGRVYRLPTEAEWEYACRAGTQTRFSVGDELTTADANINALPVSGAPRPLGRAAVVGSYPPNPFGLYDMQGNVWEWCWDTTRKYTRKPQTDPVGGQRVYRILRGGAWDMPAAYCRSDFRTDALSGYVMAGFRVICDVD